jgi:voltage-gated potassium channel
MSALLNNLRAAFHEPATRIYRVVQGTVWGLIVASILLLVAEALLPETSRLKELVGGLDRVLLAIFALEISLRVATFYPPELKVFHPQRMGRLQAHLRARLLFLIRPMTLVDILAVLAFFPELRGLRALRLLRLLRTNRIFRYRNPFAIVLQAFEENGLLFTFAFSVLGVMTVMGGLSSYLVESRVNPSINSVFDGMWWALVTVTTVGFGDIAPVTTLGRIIGGVLMIGGMFSLALFAGIVGSSLVNGIVSIREEQFRMSDYVDHVVVCGYDESTRILLEAISREVALEQTRVVVVDDQERPRNLPPAFTWVQGDPTKESELDKLRISHASAVVVSGARDMSPQAADARTILTVFTLRSYLQHLGEQVSRRLRPLYVVAEILDSENVDHARAAGADEVIETRKIGFSMIAHAIRHHGTANTVGNVLINNAENNFYVGQIPDDHREPVPMGALMRRLRLSDQGVLVLGLRLPDCVEILNPPRDYPVLPGTMLIYLADRPVLEPPP